MAPDDFSVIAYKILSYAYGCLKSGVEPSWAKAQELAGCNTVYFCAVISSLADSGYIGSTKAFRDMNGDLLEWSEPLRVTLEGAEFVANNSTMGRAKQFLGKAWEGVLAAAISATSAL